MSRILDFDEVEAALKRAAHRAIHGTREERSGRFLQSAAIVSVKYDKGSKVMDVTFGGGRTYRYLDVPPEAHAGLRDAGSKSHFFGRNIKDKFAYDEVGGERSAANRNAG